MLFRLRLGNRLLFYKFFGEVQSQRSFGYSRRSGWKPLLKLHPDFQNGGQVSEGDIILRIDPSNADTALALVRADMADAQADLREANPCA